MNKKNIRLVLFIWDIVAILLIFFSVFVMFESVIKKLLINSNIDDYYAIIDDIKDEYRISIDFLNEKPTLPYRESIIDILNYLKLSSLNKLKFENSLAMIISNDDSLEYIIGTNKNKKIELQRSKINLNNLLTEYNYRDQKRYFEFDFLGKKYIGVSDFFTIGVHKDLDKKNIEKFNPIIVTADLQSDFFSQINTIRNFFLFILGIIFLTVFIIKINNTLVVTKEIKEISNSIKKESLAIEEKGEIGTALKTLKLLFQDTSYLYDSYSTLNDKLGKLGDIITGIADKELFTATLRDDKSILDPHEVNMSILFLDVKGFTTIAEKYKEKSMNIINYIWNAVESIIYKYNGKINKYIGDAALIIFPEYIYNDKDLSTKNAIYAGISILENVFLIRDKLKIDFNFRIGIDYGRLVYGKTGSDRNYELGVIGDPVNTASRFENLNKQYNTNILLTETALKNSGFSPNKNYNFKKDGMNKWAFYMVDRARPSGKKNAKDIFTIILKNEKQCCFLGAKTYYPEELFTDFSRLIRNFIINIKYWQNNNIEEGKLKWMEMAKHIGKIYYKYKFSLAEIFLNKLLKYDELMKYKEDPLSWFHQKEIKIKIPDADWIKYGAIELSK